MRIKSLQLNNFRCFDDITIDFDPYLTVIVGINGSGKTTILQALRAILMPLQNYVRINQIICSNLSKYDIKINSKNDIVLFKLYIDSFEINIPFESFKTPVYLSDFGNFFQIAEKIRENIKEFPLIISYSSERYISDDDILLNQHYSLSHDNVAYMNNNNQQLDYKSTLLWFKEADNMEARYIRDNNDLNYRLTELQAVRHVISKILLDRYEKPTLNKSGLELTLREKNTNNIYTLTQLSHGFKAMLTLAIDLARRMIQANQNIEFNDINSILSLPAIVLIDEIELHLHPSWQQTVIPTLRAVFPETQFIITTHSPQVITSIENKYIRILDGQNIYTSDLGTFGASSERVLEHIFEVKPRPDNKVTNVLNQYFKLIHENKGKSAEAIALRNQLNVWLKDDPSLFDADLFIKNLEMAAEMNKNYV
jgi:predicted ATP-binding protein involved in virulence